jgi:hypothetical protein
MKNLFIITVPALELVLTQESKEPFFTFFNRSLYKIGLSGVEDLKISIAFNELRKEFKFKGKANFAQNAFLKSAVVENETMINSKVLGLKQNLLGFIFTEIVSQIEKSYSLINWVKGSGEDAKLKKEIKFADVLTRLNVIRATVIANQNKVKAVEKNNLAKNFVSELEYIKTTNKETAALNKATKALALPAPVVTPAAKALNDAVRNKRNPTPATIPVVA